jgi:hypothetical protein
MLHAVPQHDGGPHVEIIGDKYHYVVTERGSELERKITTDRQELLYWLISGVVFEMVGDFELSIASRARIFVASCSPKKLS